jgi:hypothetical protein
MSTSLFTLSSKQRGGKVMMRNTLLAEEYEATYLVVIFDKRKTWKPNIAE